MVERPVLTAPLRGANGGIPRPPPGPSGSPRPRPPDENHQHARGADPTSRIYGCCGNLNELTSILFLHSRSVGWNYSGTVGCWM